MSSEIAETLRKAIKDRKNILIAGATGTGKTTLLNAVAAEIPDEERIFGIGRTGLFSERSVEQQPAHYSTR